MRYRKTAYSILAIITLTTAAIAFAPWKALLQQKIIATLEQQGLSPAHVTVASLGIHGVQLNDIAVGEPPLRLANATIGYSLATLRNGALNSAQLSGLAIAITRTTNGWSIEGLPAFSSAPSSPATTAFPTDSRLLDALPIRELTLINSSISLSANGWKLNAPLTLTLHKNAPAQITLTSNNITATKGDLTLAIGKLSATMTLDLRSQQWRGEWSITDINFAGSSLEIPALAITGTLQLGADALTLHANMQDSKRSYTAQMDVDYQLNKPAASTATLNHARIPFGGGTVGVERATIPLAGKQPMHFNLDVNRIPISTLLHALSSSQATATGVVSGTVPLTVATNGEVHVGNASLKAEAPGIISLPPDAIPGDNSQVSLVRDVLKNLHYTLLSLELESAANQALSVLLKVEGANPDVEKGRPIKLQVHLRGDVLHLIQQNMQLMNDPKSFIRQESHEKN